MRKRSGMPFKATSVLLASKFRDLPPGSQLLYFRAGILSGDELSDGVITARAVRSLGHTKAQAEALVACGWWRAGVAMGSYVIEGWTDLHMTAEAWKAEQDRWRESKRSRRTRDVSDHAELGSNVPRESRRESTRESTRDVSRESRRESTRDVSREGSKIQDPTSNPKNPDPEERDLIPMGTTYPEREGAGGWALDPMDRCAHGDEIPFEPLEYAAPRGDAIPFARRAR